MLNICLKKPLINWDVDFLKYTPNNYSSKNQRYGRCINGYSGDRT